MNLTDWLNTVEWIVSSRDVRTVQAQVARYLKSFQLKPRQGAHYHGHVAHKKLGRLDLTIVGYGADIELDAGKLGHFSILQWPLAGSYVLQVGGRELRITQDVAHLIPPGVPVRMVFSADCLLLVVRMSAQGAQSLGAEIDAENLLSQGAADALGLPLDLSTPSGETLKRTLTYMTEESFLGGLLLRERVLGRMVEDVFLAALKEALRAWTAPPKKQEPARAADAPPRYLARAEAYLLSNLAEAVTLEDAAKAAGVSPSQLMEAFRQHRALSPMAWWRTKRLDRAYEDLTQAGQTGVSVTDVGLAWGFMHLGRFSSAYAKRFGESPRQTLQRAKSLGASD